MHRRGCAEGLRTPSPRPTQGRRAGNGGGAGAPHLSTHLLLDKLQQRAPVHRARPGRGPGAGGRGRRPRPGGASLRTTPLRPGPPAPPTPLGAASRSRPPPPHTPPLPAQPLAVRTRARPARGRARARTARGAWLQCRRPRPAPGCSSSSRGAAAGKLSHARHASPFCAHPFAPGWASEPMPPPRGRLQRTTHCWGLPPPGSLKAPPSLTCLPVLATRRLHGPSGEH